MRKFPFRAATQAQRAHLEQLRRKNAWLEASLWCLYRPDSKGGYYRLRAPKWASAAERGFRRRATDWDPEKIKRNELGRLRREYEGGDLLALNEAYLLTVPKPRNWVEEMLSKRLAWQLEKSPEGRRRRKRLEREQVRFETFEWFRRHGCGWAEAMRLAALALDEGRTCGGESTVLHAHRDFKKRYGLAPRKPGTGPEPLKSGFEDMTPADLPGGPNEKTLHRILSAYRAEK